MAESRDRLSRANTSFGNQRQVAHGLAIFPDEADVDFGTLFRWGTTPLTGVTLGPLGMAATRGRGSGVGRDNIPSRSSRRGQGRGGGSLLPSWYPRAPLQDITAIVRAIERRAARTLRESEEDQQTDSPIPPQDQIPHEPSLSVQLEHNFSLNHSTAEADDHLTPQPSKMLVNNIGSVDKAVLEEIRTLKSTPSSKKAERVRKMRTLMSMR